MFQARHYENLEQLLRCNPVLRNFAALCSIPRPSFKEKQISDYLLAWAGERGLEATQDSHWNVLIKKPATPGYEAAPPVILQAHIDMVCEKAPGVLHDFDRDPISLQLDGDLLSTGGKTTLGADDGIGVACAMAILESDSLAHPALEVLLTTAEEEDLSGAQTVDASAFRARLLINIDNATEHELLAGSCGGMGVELLLPACCEPVAPNGTAWQLEISGLPGGHSGEDIHRGHGNANILLGRLLYAYHQLCELRIASVVGGSFRLALPRDASAVFFAPAAQEAQLQAATEQLAQQFCKEYACVAPALSVTLKKVTPATRQAASSTAVRGLLAALLLSPNGIAEMNNAVAGVVESSDNLGEVRMDGDQFVLVYEIRASLETTGEFLYQKIALLAELLGGQVNRFAAYPSWEFRPVSPLREHISALYEAEFGEKMTTLVVHSGLECGCFSPKMPGLDAISIGPDTWGLHSPEERLSIRSTERIYHLLTTLLSHLH